MQPELRALFLKQLDVDVSKLSPLATLDSVGLDSLAVIEFLFEVEDLLKIKIPEIEVPPTTLGGLVAMLDPLIAEGDGKLLT